MCSSILHIRLQDTVLNPNPSHLNPSLQAFAVKPEGPIRPTAAMSGSDAPFNADSTYKNDFGPKEAAYNRVKPKNDYEPNQGPFYGESTYKGDFMAKAVAPAQPITRQGNLQTAGPFEGKTMYQDSYQ